MCSDRALCQGLQQQGGRSLARSGLLITSMQECEHLLGLMNLSSATKGRFMRRWWSPPYNLQHITGSVPTPILLPLPLLCLTLRTA